MGYCFSYDSLKTNNQSEDFCRDILRTFKARDISIESISTGLLSIQEQTDRLDYLKKNIFDSSSNKNPRLKFHEALLNIPNSTTSFDNNQFIILKLLTIACTSDNKLNFLKTFFHIETLQRLLSIIKVVVQINLKEYNEVILQIVNEDKESNYTDIVKDELREVVTNVYSQRNIDEFTEMLCNKIQLLVGSSDENSIGNNDKFWIEAKEILAFSLNCIELRHYVFIRYENA